MKVSAANLLLTLNRIRNGEISFPPGLRGVVALNYGKELLDLEQIEAHVRAFQDRNDIQLTEFLLPRDFQAEGWLQWWERALAFLFLFRAASSDPVETVVLEGPLVVTKNLVFDSNVIIKGDISFDIEQDAPPGIVVLGDLKFENCTFVKHDYDKTLDIVCLGNVNCNFLSMGSGKVVIGGNLKSEIVFLHYNHAELAALGGVDCALYAETDTIALVATKLKANAVFANESNFYDPTRENEKAAYTSHTNLFGIYTLGPAYNRISQLKSLLLPEIWQAIITEIKYSKFDAEYSDTFEHKEQSERFEEVEANHFWLMEVVENLIARRMSGENVFA